MRLNKLYAKVQLTEGEKSEVWKAPDDALQLLQCATVPDRELRMRLSSLKIYEDVTPDWLLFV